MNSLLIGSVSPAVLFLVCLICLFCFGLLWSVSRAKPFALSGRRSRFEPLEVRLPLDTQIGTVTMPYDGYLSAAVYDSNGQIIRTLLAQAPEQAGNIPLMWDGKDQLGRPVSQSGTYTWKALTSQINPVDQGGVGDTEAVPDKIAPNQGYNLQSLATSVIGGLAGDVGGTFVRRGDSESYFGDTTLSQSYSLNSAIAASGKFFVSDVTTMIGVASFTGHFSSSTADDRREFIGLEFQGGDNPGNIYVRGRIYASNGTFFTGSSSNNIALTVGTGYYNWDYSYDPNFEADGNHAGPEGRLTLRVYNNAGVDQTLYATNTGDQRDAGATFDAFGMGISKLEPNFGNNSALTGKVFIDDIAYSGNTGVVDFTSNPGWVGSANTSDGNNFGWNQYSNADGSLYMASFLEESQEAVVRLAADGTWQWGRNYPLSIGIAADETYFYVSRHISDQDRIYRHFARDGAPAPFAQGVEYLVVNSSAPDPILPGQQIFHYTPEQWRTFGSVWGMAADGYRLWISDYRNNRIMVYDRATGSLQGQYSVTKPLGMAVDTASSGSGTIWVANNGDRLTKITFNGSFSSSTTITGLSDPTGVTIGGLNHHLFVAESGLHRIKEYDISGTPVLAGLQTFGSKSTGGPITDSQFYWVNTFGNLASIAIDPSGILSVNDEHRVQRFYTVTGGGHTAGELYDSLSSEFAPSPIQTYNYTAGGKHYLVSNRNVYEVDPEYTAGPRTGWLGNGTWRLAERYNFGIGEESAGPGLRRTLMDGATPRELFYFMSYQTIVAYTVESGSQRQAAIVGVNWTGPDRTQSANKGRYNWTDADGDGIVDWNGIGSGTDGEVTWDIPLGQEPQIFYGFPWVDDAGNIWYTDVNRNLIKVPFEGFVDSTNGKRNPKYDWAHRQIVVPFQNDQYGFIPFQVRIAGNGDIYALGWASTPAGTYTGINGADWIARYNSAGVRQFIAPSVDNVYSGIAIDAADSDPDYFFTGETIYANMFTKDGLFVAKFTTGPGSGAPSGWMDHPNSIGAFTHPVTGKMYVYGEEVFFGKSTRWRIDNLNTIQRQENTFSYTVPGSLGGHWEFDNSVTDAAGASPGTFFGGTATYATGQVGNAIDLDGVDDYVSLPYSADFNGYTIAAWVKPTDVTSVNIVARESGNFFETPSHQVHINANSKFEHFNYDGSNKVLTGTTTVQSNTWYHVAITANAGGMMRLYVNGVEEGTAIGVNYLWNGYDRFNVGGSNSIVGAFDGLIDDVRIYGNQLSQAEIQAIYTGTVKPGIAVTVSDATAAEQTTDRGAFVIRRDSTNGNLTVNYTLTGTATNNSDYSSIAGSVTIPSGQTSVTITVTPIDDGTADANETVILTLSTNANYTVISPNSATVKIVDNDTTTVDPNGRWQFEDLILGHGPGRELGLSDSAGSNNGANHGTAYFDEPINSPAYDGPATYATGQIGKAVSLDGKNDTINIPYSNDASAYTIAAWVKPASILWYNPTLVGLESIIARTDIDGMLPTNVSEQIRINASGRFEHYTSDGSGKTVTGTTVAQVNTWYHVAIVASNNGTMRLYVNGVEEGTAQSIGTLWTGGDRFSVGSRTPGMSSAFKGLVDDLQIYDVPLTAAQIQAIYNQTSTVTVSAADPNAAEPSDTGTFVLTRTTTSGNLVVNYSISGTATSGSDFSAVGSSVTIPNGQASATITVTPIDDSTVESSETVVLTVGSGTGYSVGTPNSATVTIADNEPIVTVSATDPNASEQGPTTGTFTFTRTNTTGDLVVNFTKSGTATNATDYTSIANSVTILSGQTTATVTVTPVDDSTSEGDETVIFTISSSANYTVGTPNSAALSIADNESTVIVSAADTSATETAGNTGTFVFTRTNTSGDLVVNFTKSGTATNGTDYTSIANSVTILSGQATATVTVTPSDDSTAEGDETVILTISSSAGYTVGSPNSASVTIADNEATVTVSATDASATETAGNTGTFVFTRSNTTGNLVVDFVKTGTATNGTDYTSIANSVTILSGQTTATVTVTPVDDSTAEVDETVILTISSSANYFVGTPNSATVTIVDNEPIVTITASDASATETAGNTGKFTVTRTNTTENLVVNFVKSGTATNSTDYTSIASSVTILSGQTTATITVTPVDDSAAEGDETVIITISSSSDYTVGTPDAATVTITDNEPTVTVAAGDASAAEPSDTGTYIVTRTNTNGNLVVNYTMGGTATSGSDYSALAGSMTISSGVSTATVTLTPINDSTSESSETAILTLSTSANYFVGSPNSATVTIADNDAQSANGRWQFENNLNDSVGSNHGTFSGGTAAYAPGKIGQSINLDGTDDNLDLPYVTDPTALTMTAWVKPTDVTSVSIMARSSSNINDGSNMVRISSNSKFEYWIYATSGNHTVTGTTTVQADTWYHLAVVATNNGQMRLYVNGVEEGTAQSIGTMWDAGDRFRVGNPYGIFGLGYFDGLVDDLRVYEQALSASDIQTIYNEQIIAVTATDANAAEPSDTGTFTFTRNNSSGNLVVNYTVSGTATNGTDYTSIANSVTILSGQTTATVTVTPSDDGTSEGDEMVVVTISSSANYNISSPNSATVIIADNDAPPVTGRWRFDSNLNDSVGSNNGTFNGGTAAYASGKIGQAIDLDGADDHIHLPYVTDPNALTMTAWVKPIDVTSVNIMARSSFNINDGSNMMRINSNSKFEYWIYATDGNHTVTGTTTVQPDSWYHVAVVATNNGMMRLYVNGVEEGTAQSIATMWDAGDSFRIGNPYSIFGLGYFDGLVDDVRIYEQALSASNILAVYNEPIVTIAASDPNAAEPSDTGTFTFTRNNTSGNLVVNFTRTGTATSGTDFSALASSVTILSGQTTATVTVTPIDDSTADANETVILTVSSSANYSVGTPDNATVTIADNEPVVTITATDAIAIEPGTNTGTFVFTRTNTSGDLVVNFTKSGTATNGTDYTSIANSVTIASGQTTTTVTVTASDDASVEGNETVVLTISTNTNYNVGTPDSATVTIIDNEAVPANGQWKFDNNLNDSVGSNNGTFSGGTAAYATGKANQAIDLDGTNDYVEIPYSNDPTAFTMTAWVKPTDVTSVNIMARSSSNINDGSNMMRINSNSKFEYWIYATSGNHTVTGTTTAQADTWYHVAVVASNNGMMRLYVNGVEEGTAQSIGTMWDAGDRFRVGVPYSLFGLGYFDGLVDDMRIYEQALNDSQIEQLYSATPPNGQWKFDNNLNDSVGVNNGTFNGGTAAYATGKIGQAIDLDGVDDNLDLPYVTDPTALTMTAWIKPTDVTSVNIMARGSSDISQGSNMMRINSNSKFEYWIYATSGNHTVTGTTTLQANTWYHLAAVATNSGMMRLYVNGVEEGTAQSIGTMWDAGDRFRVGNPYSIFGLGYFDGLVDDVRIYEQALSAPELVAISQSHAFADDGFESGNGSGGFGWAAAWTLSGAASVVSTGTPNSGSYHLQLTGNTGSATRAVNLSGVTNARLVFDWKANSFEAGDSAVVEIFNGSSWVTVQTISDGQDDNVYHHSDIDLSGYTLGGSFQVRIRSLMSAADDFFYIDDLQIAF